METLDTSLKETLNMDFENNADFKEDDIVAIVTAIERCLLLVVAESDDEMFKKIIETLSDNLVCYDLVTYFLVLYPSIFLNNPSVLKCSLAP